jgi:hypothetical protein
VPTLDECNFRVVVKGRDPERDFKLAIDVASDVILFGGHGGGMVGAGGELPEVDTWSVYAKADSADEAEAAVADAIKGLDPQRLIVSTEAFDPSKRTG